MTKPVSFFALVFLVTNVPTGVVPYEYVKTKFRKYRDSNRVSNPACRREFFTAYSDIGTGNPGISSGFGGCPDGGFWLANRGFVCGSGAVAARDNRGLASVCFAGTGFDDGGDGGRFCPQVAAVFGFGGGGTPVSNHAPAGAVFDNAGFDFGASSGVFGVFVTVAGASGRGSGKGNLNFRNLIFAGC